MWVLWWGDGTWPQVWRGRLIMPWLWKGVQLRGGSSWAFEVHSPNLLPHLLHCTRHRLYIPHCHQHVWSKKETLFFTILHQQEVPPRCSIGQVWPEGTAVPIKFCECPSYSIPLLHLNLNKLLNYYTTLHYHNLISRLSLSVWSEQPLKNLKKDINQGKFPSWGNLPIWYGQRSYMVQWPNLRSPSLMKVWLWIKV